MKDKARLIPVSEAAVILGLHPVTLRRHIRNGTIKGKQIGGRYYITSKTMDRLLR